jgi:hypothetical protein
VRDGRADFARRTLARREAFLAALAADPVRSTAPVDREAYLRNLVRRRPERGLDRRTLWLLATAKANQAERFAVGLAELYGRVTEASDPVVVHLQLQEAYHTRLLADVVSLFGLPVHPRPPAWPARALVAWVATAPERWVRALAGAGEMVGCVVFAALGDAGVALAADEPGVAARIRLLTDEILADEATHTGWVAARLGPAGRALMRALYRLLGPRLACQLPELRRLVGRAELVRRLRRFDVARVAAALPDRTFLAAIP